MFARVPPQQDTTALFSRLRNSTVRTQPVKGAICSAVSTRGQSRPLALEQCGYERGCIQSRKNRSTADNKDAQQKKHVLTLTSHLPAMFRNNVTSRLKGFTRFQTCTAPNPESDKLTEAKHTDKDLPTLIAADTASNP